MEMFKRKKGKKSVYGQDKDYEGKISLTEIKKVIKKFKEIYEKEENRVW